MEGPLWNIESKLSNIIQERDTIVHKANLEQIGLKLFQICKVFFFNTYYSRYTNKHGRPQSELSSDREMMLELK